MKPHLRIDFVSDVVCPWCAVGLSALERAVERLADELEVEWHFQPFELNPGMGPEGEDIAEHLQRKYGYGPEQLAQAQARIRARGAEVGFDFPPGVRQRTHNTRRAHRLLHWAGTQGPSAQHRLKRALLQAYHTHGRNPDDVAVLVDAAQQAGLDPAAAQQVASSDAWMAEVEQQERYYQQAGIHSVPAIVINQRHLISGGQPVEVFEQALREIAASAAATPASASAPAPSP